MKLICPFCLSRAPEVPRCPVCHAVLPARQTPAPMEVPGCTELVTLHPDASGTWMAGKHGETEVLVWAGAAKAGEKNPSPAGMPNLVAPLESGQTASGFSYCVWEMPESTLAAHTRQTPAAGYRLWEELQKAGIMDSEAERYPFEIVMHRGQWRALSGRILPEFPPAGTLHAPERLTGAPISEKTRVFTAAAWFLYIISGQYPMGIPTPASWKRKNLDALDEVLFNALRTEPSRRPSMAEFKKRLQEAISGPPLTRWVLDGVFWVLGAGLLAAWAGGLIWIATHFHLL